MEAFFVNSHGSSLSCLVWFLTQAGHPFSPSPLDQANCRSANAVGRCQPGLWISLPLLTTWKNTFLCYIIEWTEAELSVPSETACSQNDIMSSLGLLSFHLLPVSLMVNYPSVCFSVCLPSSLSVHEFLFVSAQLVNKNYFQFFLSPTLELSRSYRCIFLPFSTSTLPQWPPTKGHPSLMYREVPGMLFLRENKSPCQL